MIRMGEARSSFGEGAAVSRFRVDLHVAQLEPGLVETVGRGVQMPWELPR